MSSGAYVSCSPKLYRYPDWELPAMNVLSSHSLLSLSGTKKLLEERQSTMPHLVGLPRPEANYILFNERFYELLIDEHQRSCEYFSLENVKVREEEEKDRAQKLQTAQSSNDQELVQMLEYQDFLSEAKQMMMEQDRDSCERRRVQLSAIPSNIFPPLEELHHGDIIQFRNERLQFSFYLYKAIKGTFNQLLIKFKQHVAHLIPSDNAVNFDDRLETTLSPVVTTEWEFILVPSIEPDGYGIPSVFNDAPLHYFQNLSPGLMFRWIYPQLIDSSMEIYRVVQEEIESKKQCPRYRSLVNEAGPTADDEINELEDGEEMTIEDLESFPEAYVLIYDEVRTKLNVEWRKVDSNFYCNQHSSMFLLTKWTQQLQARRP